MRELNGKRITFGDAGVMWLFLGSDSERFFRPAGWASLISSAVYSPVIMASHYRAAALRETLEKLPTLVPTSQNATPRHTAGTFPFVRAYLLA